MFLHNFKYSLKTLFKSRLMIFWTYAFPILLGTFFSMAFSDIEDNEKLGVIDIAVVKDDEFMGSSVENSENSVLQAFEHMGDGDNEDRIFNITYTDAEEASKLLKDGKITGYVMFENGAPHIVTASSGINETVLKYAVEEIMRYGVMAADGVVPGRSDINISDISGENLSYTMIEFYTLIAMTCMYGGLLGMVALNYTLANMSNTGKRVSVSPMGKGKMILGSVLAGYITQLVGVAILFAYTVFVLKVDYGSKFAFIVLLTLAGCFAGLTLGIMVAGVVKAGENTKTGIMIAVTMLGCFLSGMMGITMKYVVDKNIPIVNMLNPTAMITDGLYSLYYYDTLDRFFFNLISLLIFSVLMIVISYRSLRRQTYDSI